METFNSNEPKAYRGDIFLISPAELSLIPDGTTLIGVDGERAIKGIDVIGLDTKSGLLGWGVPVNAIPVGISPTPNAKRSVPLYEQ